MISGKWLFCAALLSVVLSAPAHDLPLSYVDLRLNGEGIEVRVESSAKNFSRELGDLDEPTMLASPPANRLLAVVTAGLTISSAGETLAPELRVVEPLPGRRDIGLQLHFPRRTMGDAIQVRGALFPADPRHKTFLNIYEDEALKYQGIFDRTTTLIEYRRNERQSIVAVARRFLLEGIHHIFIGPDHILFIVGLLLLGGSLGHLLKIITAFTIAHSLTLVLATLNLLNPPARMIEPIIALSIVFVGAHALLHRGEKRDWRLLFAFGFGFIHGFGFANVLRDMALPRTALGWSLFSFNVGVEIGQACIVLAVAPALALLYRRNAALAERVVAAAAFCVVFAGSFWFAQRLFP
jgi:hydrogenase/urease accessory protein HupE